MKPELLAKQNETVASAVRLLKAGGVPEKVLAVVYQQGRMDGLLEMAKLADKLKQREEQPRKAA